MGTCPCQDCPYRKLTCHDQCDDYMAYHDALVNAKRKVMEADAALGFLMGNYRARKDKWVRKTKCNK